MADPLLDLLKPHLEGNEAQSAALATPQVDKYLSRLLSLRPSDLTTTEPQSLQQSSQSNLLSIQALSSRSHRSLISSSDQLSSLQDALPSITRTTLEIKNHVPALDESAVNFATAYSRARDTQHDSLKAPSALSKRKESLTLSNEAEKLQDILDLPDLLSSAITAASTSSATTKTTTSTTSSTNYTLALDLYTHIKRLHKLYPNSALIASLQPRADAAMSEMITSLLTSLRAQNLRVAAAIRTIGWLRRVMPELAISQNTATSNPSALSSYSLTSSLTDTQSEGSYGALFLVARLSTFLNMTEVALAPLRDLADQETEKRLSNSTSTAQAPSSTARGSGYASTQGTQTERFLKSYIEIFREQGFGTIQMYRNIFPQPSHSHSDATNANKDDELIQLPSALASFPLHLVNLLKETLQTYLPNVIDPVARESLLVQVLYAAGSLGRLGCDFSLMIGLLDLGDGDSTVRKEGEQGGQGDATVKEPEWYRVMRKHKVQAARLDAMAGGVERRVSGDVAVR